MSGLFYFFVVHREPEVLSFSTFLLPGKTSNNCSLSSGGIVFFCAITFNRCNVFTFMSLVLALAMIRPIRPKLFTGSSVDVDDVMDEQKLTCGFL